MKKKCVSYCCSTARTLLTVVGDTHDSCGDPLEQRVRPKLANNGRTRNGPQQTLIAGRETGASLSVSCIFAAVSNAHNPFISHGGGVVSNLEPAILGRQEAVPPCAVGLDMLRRLLLYDVPLMATLRIGLCSVTFCCFLWLVFCTLGDAYLLLLLPW